MKNEIEINLIALIKQLLKAKWYILFFSFLSSLIGVAVALSSPVKFESSVVFIPNKNEAGSSALSGVANLIGINLNSNSNENFIQPLIYPLIGESAKFKRMLLNSIIDKEKMLDLNTYIFEKEGLVDLDFLNEDSRKLAERQDLIFKIVSEFVQIKVNLNDGGYITINCVMSDPEYAASLANNSKEILQQLIIEKKIESAKQYLNFSEKQLYIKKKEFDSIQFKLANYKDSNLNLVNSSSIGKLDKIQAEFDIISAVVLELSKQVQQAKLQISKDTPVFSTIKEAVVPYYRKSPKRTKIVILYGIIGFLITSFYVLIKDSILQIIKELKN